MFLGFKVFMQRNNEQWSPLAAAVSDYRSDELNQEKLNWLKPLFESQTSTIGYSYFGMTGVKVLWDAEGWGC